MSVILPTRVLERCRDMAAVRLDDVLAVYQAGDEADRWDRGCLHLYRASILLIDTVLYSVRVSLTV